MHALSGWSRRPKKDRTRWSACWPGWSGLASRQPTCSCRRSSGASVTFAQILGRLSRNERDRACPSRTSKEASMADQIRAWAQAQWGEAELGDARRTRRAVDIGAAMAAGAGLSLPRQMTSWAELKAAYHLFDQPQASHAALTAPHRRATRHAAEAERGVVLFVQDTTELDFTAHPATQGLGSIGNGNQRGLLVHSCLAMRPDPSARPLLGLADQQVWVRTQSGLRHQPRRQRLARSKQSDVWTNSLAAIGPAPERAVWVSVGDRESDIFDHLFRARALGWHALVRARHDRTLDDPLGPGLLSKIRAQPAQASRTVVLSRRAGG